MREIHIVIDTDGSVSVEAVGYEGADCEKATEYIEQALGRPEKRQRKPEYYRRQARSNTVKQR
jgi:hypothetical protein